MSFEDAYYAVHVGLWGFVIRCGRLGVHIDEAELSLLRSPVLDWPLKRKRYQVTGFKPHINIVKHCLMSCKVRHTYGHFYEYSILFLLQCSLTNFCQQQDVQTMECTVLYL